MRCSFHEALNAGPPALDKTVADSHESMRENSFPAPGSAVCSSSLVPSTGNQDDTCNTRSNCTNEDGILRCEPCQNPTTKAQQRRPEYTHRVSYTQHSSLRLDWSCI